MFNGLTISLLLITALMIGAPALTVWMLEGT